MLYNVEIRKREERERDREREREDIDGEKERNTSNKGNNMEGIFLRRHQEEKSRKYAGKMTGKQKTQENDIKHIKQHGCGSNVSTAQLPIVHKKLDKKKDLRCPSSINLLALFAKARRRCQRRDRCHNQNVERGKGDEKDEKNYV